MRENKVLMIRVKINKQQYRQMLDEQSNQNARPQRQTLESQRSMQNEPTPKTGEVPPEFMELAKTVEQNQKKNVSFEPVPSNFPSIPEGQDMFKNMEFKGTNTQKITELQLKFQNEILILKSKHYWISKH